MKREFKKMIFNFCRIPVFSILILIFLNSIFGMAHPQGKGKKHRYGKNRQQMTDRNGDGIEDGFQNRYGRNRMRNLVNKHLPWIEKIMELPDTSQMRMICRENEIPDWKTTKNQDNQSTIVIVPPLQYYIEENQTLIIFYSWLSPESAVHRWYLSLKDGVPVKLEGILIFSPHPEPHAQSDILGKPKITWQEDK